MSLAPAPDGSGNTEAGATRTGKGVKPVLPIAR